MNSEVNVACQSVDALLQNLQSVGYFADRRLATAVFLALKLQRPLLLEGEPGVGKTALAQALAQVLSRQMIRLQCYDGMEQREALYEWNYAAQLLHLRAAEMRAPTLGTDVSSLPPRRCSQPWGGPAAARRAAAMISTASSRSFIKAAIWCAGRCCRLCRPRRPVRCC